MTCDCICHTAYFSTLVNVVYVSSIGHEPLSHLYVAFSDVVVVLCIYSCPYDDTSYTLVICLGMSQWCDNEKHDMPQHVIWTVKKR
jgi:hypothetical protein